MWWGVGIIPRGNFSGVIVGQFSSWVIFLGALECTCTVRNWPGDDGPGVIVQGVIILEPKCLYPLIDT